MEEGEKARRYMDRWFWTLEQLARSVGVGGKTVLELISAGCAPGPIYILGNDGGWWSALERAAVPPAGRCWYSPGAAWGLRRSVLAIRGGASAAEAAQAERTSFIREFVASIATIEDADLAFSDCFTGGKLDFALASDQAANEWQCWIGGGYGVCLRQFTAQTCLAKESLRAALLRSLDDRSSTADRMLRQAEALAGVILPFAPWQRASGTPGRTIDRLLGELQLGVELPYAKGWGETG